MSDVELRTRWTGQVFEPVGNFSRAWCLDNLAPDELVTFEPNRQRDMRSHRHFFAQVGDIWASLPEWLADAPYSRSPDTLRKHALIVRGFVNTAVLDCGDPVVAERVAAMMKVDGEKADGYCIVQVRGPIVTRYTAMSQKLKAMGRDDFQRSKAAVLDWLEHLLGIAGESAA